jgi:hypothetical protein
MVGLFVGLVFGDHKEKWGIGDGLFVDRFKK